MNDSQRPEVVVGRRVRLRRKDLDISQQEVAARMRRQGFLWRQTTVAKTEAATRPLRVDELAALARLLEVDIPHLLQPTITSEEDQVRARLADARAAWDKTEKAKEDLARTVDNLSYELSSYEQSEREHQAEIEDCMLRLEQLRAAEGDVPRE